MSDPRQHRIPVLPGDGKSVLGERAVGAPARGSGTGGSVTDGGGIDPLSRVVVIEARGRAGVVHGNRPEQLNLFCLDVADIPSQTTVE